jgi:hypothetical protein
VLNALGTVMSAEAVEWFVRGFETVLLTQAENAVDLPVSVLSPAPLGPAACTESDAGDRGAATASRGSLPADSEAAQALLEAVRTVNCLSDVSPHATYVMSGGRVLHIPHVLAELRRSGWVGLHLADLAGIEPLAALTDRLVYTPPPA